MSKDLDDVLSYLRAVQRHVLEYIASHIDVGRKQKAEDLLEVVRHEIFSVSAAFFADVFQVVCVTSKNA